MRTDDLLELLAASGVPSGRVYTARDALADPHYAARGMVPRLTSVGGTTMPVTGVVPRFSRTPGSIRTPGPALGAHDHLVVGDGAPGQPSAAVQSSV